MVTLKKYNLNGDAIGEVEMNDQFPSSEINGQLIKDYIDNLYNYEKTD